MQLDGKVTGVYADYQYVGTGDTGGAANEDTARMLEAIVTKSETVLPVPVGAADAADGPAPTTRHRRLPGPAGQSGRWAADA